jgi:hypothetical protein
VSGGVLPSIAESGWLDAMGVEATAGQVLSLCSAARDAKDMLALTGEERANLLEHVVRAEAAAVAVPVDLASMDAQVRAISYILVEVADGPISAFMADAAAQIIGDGIGRLFS